ncbi:MAG: iron-containing alcohol dehydrogenase [Syntrophales bacterium]|jgi:alcohol dehydrogenase YqhD (iron-dependent ADH family)|nr:iron-containing alcohol dehydrogenase [Syntrophales bacterium]MCK9528402.1 iron-containing alcohol dehydrogenase [Syntrophales bacterium]MDX9922673.1 iron-containing alcohol dehydrogenase [Syntrophales bacterium]
MKNFIFENPTKIIFGEGQIARIGGETRRFGRRVLFVYGKGSIKENGVYDQVTASLSEAGLEVVEWPGVRPNPVLSHVREGIELARRENVEAVLAAGGGSVIDEAKTIAAGVPAEQDVWDYFTCKAVITAALPVLTVLTLSASASEMNPTAVITREEGAQKFSIRSPHIQPKTSILDPTVLYSLSSNQSAYGAVDAITHMLEGYFNGQAAAPILQEGLVETLTRVIMGSMETILANPRDYDARAAIMWATTLAFNGLVSAGIGRFSLPAHMIEHSLSALYDVAHGAGLSIVLPGWMRYAAADGATEARIARFARRIFAVDTGDDSEAARAGTEALKAWFRSIGSPVSLNEVGIPEADINRIALNAALTADVWGMRDYTLPVIEAILEQCR